MESFETDLSDMSWNEVYRESDVDKSYCSFVSTFKKIVDKHAPLKTKRVKQKNVQWITKEIREMISQRDKQVKKARKTGHEEDWKGYQQMITEIKQK